MATQDVAGLRLKAAKTELKAALSSLERVDNHEYSPHKAALIRGAQFQIERALRITGQIYLTSPPKIEQQPLKKATQLPIEDANEEDNK